MDDLQNPPSDLYLSSQVNLSTQKRLSLADLNDLLAQLNESAETNKGLPHRHGPSIKVEGHANVTAGGDIKDNIIAHINIEATKAKRTTPVRQIRAAIPDFTGRSELIESIANNLRCQTEGGAYLIRGMGGIGKTELAIKVANILAANYADAQLFINLQRAEGSPREPSEILKYCIRTLTDADDLPDDLNDLSAMYCDCLNGKRALILLDNAVSKEQVLPFLRHAGCLLLVTSRTSFALSGLTPIILDGLGPAEARELLLDICPRIPAAIADQIAFLCGYLPLAIRAAGSLLQVEANLDPEDYVEQLKDERTRLEAISESDGSEVEACFNLSYRLLAAGVARVFRELSIFPSSFSGSAEVVICQDPAHKALNELLRQSLILYDDQTKRYWLHNLMRLFAAKLITPEEQSQVALRHAQHYVRIFHMEEDRKQSEPGTEVSHLEEIEWDNLKAGQSWAATQFLSSAEDPAAAKLCADYAAEALTHFRPLFPPRELIRWAESGLAAQRKLENPAREAFILRAIGVLQGRLGENELALDFHLKAADLFRNLGDSASEMDCLLRAGTACRELENPQQAITYLEQVRASFNETTGSAEDASVLTELGRAYADTGDKAAAIELFQQALNIAENLEESFDKGRRIGKVAWAFQDLNKFDEALSLNQEALRIFQKVGHRSGEASTLGNIGILYVRLGEYEKAFEFFDRALPLMRNVGDLFSEIVVLRNMSSVYSRKDDYHRAIETLEQALNVSRTVGARPTEIEILTRLADGFIVLNQPVRAIDYLKQAVARCEDRDHKVAVRLLHRLANLLREANQIGEAISVMREALRYDRDQAGSHFRLALLLVLNKQISEATEHAQKAFKLAPTSGQKLNLLFGCLIESDRSDEGLAIARRALPSIDGEDCYLIANLFKDLDCLEDAEQYYRVVIRREPDHPDAHLDLARILAEIPAKFEESLNEFREAIRCKPEDPLPHLFLAGYLMKTGTLEEAAEELRASVRCRSDFAPGYLHLGVISEMLRLGDNEVEKQYREALRCNPNLAQAHHYLGRTLVRQGRRIEAAAEFRQAIACDPNLGDAHYILAGWLRDQGEYSESESEYREAIRCAPQHSGAQEGLGAALYLQGHKEEAEPHIRKALELDLDNAQAHNGLGVILLDRDDFQQAEQFLRKALDLDSTLGYAHFNLGRVLLQLTRAEEAEKAFREALRLGFAESRTRTFLAISLEMQNDLVGGIEGYRRAIALEDSFAAARVGLARCLLEMDSASSEAEEQLRTAIGLEPDLTEAHFELARVLVAQNRNAEAMDALHAELQIDPDHRSSRLLLAFMLSQEGNVDEATEHYREAVARNPDLAPVHEFFAEFLKSQGRTTEAIASYREVVRCDPTNAQAHNALGSILKDQWLFSQAEVEFREAIRCDSSLDYPHINLGDLLVQLYYYEEAEVEYQEAIRLNPTDSESYHRLGSVLADLKKYDEAVQAYLKAIELLPESDGTHNNLGLVLVELGRLDEAETTYRKAIQFNSNLIQAHRNLCSLLTTQKRFGEVVDHWEKWMHQGPELIEFHQDLAASFVSQGCVDDAINVYREWISCDISSTAAHWKLIELLEQNGRVDQVPPVYRELIDREPDSSWCRQSFAEFLVKTGYQQEAEIECRRWVESKPEDATLRLCLSEILFKLDQIEEGINIGREAMRLAPDDYWICGQFVSLLKSANRPGDVELLYREWIQSHAEASRARQDLAELLSELGKTEQAEVEYLEWIRCEPKNPAASHHLSLLLAQSNRLVEAEAKAREALGHYQQSTGTWGVHWMLRQWLELCYPQGLELCAEAIALLPDETDLRRDRALSEWYHGDLDAAIADYDYLIEIDPRDAQLLTARGQVRAEKGDCQLAIEDLSQGIKVLERRSDTISLAYARSGLALAYAGLNQLEDAERCFELSIDGCPDNSWVYYNRAVVYEGLGRIAEATADFQTSLEKKSPTLTTLKRARAEAFLRGQDVASIKCS